SHDCTLRRYACTKFSVLCVNVLCFTSFVLVLIPQQHSTSPLSSQIDSCEHSCKSILSPHRQHRQMQIHRQRDEEPCPWNNHSVRMKDVVCNPDCHLHVSAWLCHVAT